MTVERFEREAQATAMLRSPHTIHLYDFGVADDGAFYYVMELLDGLDLETLVRRFGPLSRRGARSTSCARSATRWPRRTRAGSSTATSSRRTSSSAGWGSTYDFVKVLDFGLVKSARSRRPRDPARHAPDVTTGTPAFMAPELALGEADVDGRADIYALGCVAYWLLTGRLVFEADSAGEDDAPPCADRARAAVALQRARRSSRARSAGPRLPGEEPGGSAADDAGGRVPARGDRGGARVEEVTGRGVVGCCTSRRRRRRACCARRPRSRPCTSRVTRAPSLRAPRPPGSRGRPRRDS